MHAQSRRARACSIHARRYRLDGCGARWSGSCLWMVDRAQFQSPWRLSMAIRRHIRATALQQGQTPAHRAQGRRIYSLKGTVRWLEHAGKRSLLRGHTRSQPPRLEGVEHGVIDKEHNGDGRPPAYSARVRDRGARASAHVLIKLAAKPLYSPATPSLATMVRTACATDRYLFSGLARATSARTFSEGQTHGSGLPGALCIWNRRRSKSSW